MQPNEPQEYECYNCETNYQILSDETLVEVSFCPYCGADIDEDYEDEDDEEDDSEEENY